VEGGNRRFVTQRTFPSATAHHLCAAILLGGPTAVNSLQPATLRDVVAFLPSDWRWRDKHSIASLGSWDQLLVFVSPTGADEQSPSVC
jgi:hypothetical protein